MEIVDDIPIDHGVKRIQVIKKETHKISLLCDGREPKSTFGIQELDQILISLDVRTQSTSPWVEKTVGITIETQD